MTLWCNSIRIVIVWIVFHSSWPYYLKINLDKKCKAAETWNNYNWIVKDNQSSWIYWICEYCRVFDEFRCEGALINFSWPQFNLVMQVKAHRYTGFSQRVNLEFVCLNHDDNIFLFMDLKLNQILNCNVTDCFSPFKTVKVNPVLMGMLIVLLFDCLILIVLINCGYHIMRRINLAHQNAFFFVNNLSLNVEVLFLSSPLHHVNLLRRYDSN